MKARKRKKEKRQKHGRKKREKKEKRAQRVLYPLKMGQKMISLHKNCQEKS